MKYNRFEELPVWQDAIQLAVQIFELTSQPEFKGYFTLQRSPDNCTAGATHCRIRRLRVNVT